MIFMICAASKNVRIYAFMLTMDCGSIARSGASGKNTVSVRLQNLTKFIEINVKVMAVLLTLYYRPRKIIYHTIFGSVYG